MTKNLSVALCLFFAAATFCAQAQERVEATTAKGEKVILFPNGRWEFADQPKAQVQREERRVEDERERNAQGGFMGIGRRIYEGDKDYNRGSLNPNRR
ncbi:MAG: hypothetical protein ACKVQK_27160 [Burkholderiales bacterium]